MWFIMDFLMPECKQSRFACIRIRSFIIAAFFAVLLCAAGACAGRSKILPSSRTAEELFSLLNAEQARARARLGFALQGSLIYRDQTQEFHFLLDVWHDKERQFTRALLRGSLDGLIWAEIIANGSDTRVLLPQENHSFAGKRQSLTLENARGIQIRLSEILCLLELDIPIPPARKVREAIRRGRNDILLLEEDSFVWSAAEFTQSGTLMSIRDYADGYEQFQIIYENRADGPALKQTLISRIYDSRLIVWLSSYNPAWRYPQGMKI
jgi:hypothetical protein